MNGTLKLKCNGNKTTKTGWKLFTGIYTIGFHNQKLFCEASLKLQKQQNILGWNCMIARVPAAV